ncbi:MAG: hypothetical protein KG003_07610 [Bacteroidetes bacterium]|nr:hypothetical protein [Bacteroidota bacterium]
MTALLLFLFQDSSSLSSTQESMIEKIFILVATAAITGVSTYLATRRKNEADIQKLVAETIKTYVEAMNQIQQINKELRASIKELMTDVETWHKSYLKTDELLSEATRGLSDCLDSKDCPECEELLTEALDSLLQIPPLLKNVPDSEHFASSIIKLSTEISRKINRNLPE